jgi:hypothetical protein
MNIDYPFHIDGLAGHNDRRQRPHPRHDRAVRSSPFERVNRPDFAAVAAAVRAEQPGAAAALEHTIRAGLQRWLGDLDRVRG